MRCDSSSVGRALASQAEGRGFESRLSLSLKYNLLHRFVSSAREQDNLTLKSLKARKTCQCLVSETKTGKTTSLEEKPKTSK